MTSNSLFSLEQEQKDKVEIYDMRSIDMVNNIIYLDRKGKRLIVR